MICKLNPFIPSHNTTSAGATCKHVHVLVLDSNDEQKKIRSGSNLR